jgi:hypothetical protein
MTQHDNQLQASVDGLTAIEHTKRGYGLWRGEVIHPADVRMDTIVASGDPITDTKGLGLRYVPVRGERVLPHFRVHDPEKFSAALDLAFPAVHDAIVRLVAADVRAGGYAALARWCDGGALPDTFTVADVTVEKPCSAGGVSYRPDIVVTHGEGGRIELEVVNTHAPEGPRVEAAWAAGHVVLTMRVRDLVEQIVFSDGRDVVPCDEALPGLLRGRRFRLAGRESMGAEVLAVWRDLNLSEYAMEMREALRAAYRADVRAVTEPIAEIACGVTGSDIEVRVRRDPRLQEVHRLFQLLMAARYSGPESVFTSRQKDPRRIQHLWAIAARDFREALAAASSPCESLVQSDEDASIFLDQFDRASHEPPGIRRLRYAVAAVWYCRKRRLLDAADMANSLINFGDRKNGAHRRHPLVATEEGIS